MHSWPKRSRWPISDGACKAAGRLLRLTPLEHESADTLKSGYARSSPPKLLISTGQNRHQAATEKAEAVLRRPTATKESLSYSLAVCR